MNPSNGRVERVDHCRLVVGEARWAFAERHAAAIDANWARRSAENPAFFNGRIHLLRRGSLSAGGFEGELLRTDFKSYLYWRDEGFADPGVRDAFGSALMRSAEGHVLLGRQREGNINAGLAYLPGGFIDARDVDDKGRVDIRASVLREVEEETGLGARELALSPGYQMTFLGPLVSIAVEVVSALSSEALRARVLSHLAGDPKSELTDVVIVRRPEDLSGLATPDFVPPLLAHVLGRQGT